MRSYREWLPASSFDGIASLGGSFVSDRIEDYYFTPWDLDYGRLIRFDHEFVGREALCNMKSNKHRKKVSLVLAADDAARIYRSQMTVGSNGKAMEMPTAHYAAYPYDALFDPQGNHVGVSTYTSFIAPDGAWVSLAVVDEDWASEGTQLLLKWGEPDGGSDRPTVERHCQMELRATVSGWPYSKVAQSCYRPIAV